MLKKSYPSALDINKRAAKTFYENFIKRHQSLRLQKPKTASLSPANAFSKANIKLLSQRIASEI